MFEQFAVPPRISSTQDALVELRRRGPSAWHKVGLRIADRLRLNAETGCVDWLGGYSASGLPMMQLYGRQVSVAKVQWVLTGKEPTAPYQRLSRRCSRLSCLNPDHLELRNTVGHANKLKTACSNDHEFTPKNTIHYQGRRYCIRCIGNDATDVAVYLFGKQGRHEIAFNYFKWDEEQQRWTTKEERDAAQEKGE